MPVDVRAPYPPLEEIAPSGAYYLLQEHGLVRRHVESVSFHDEEAAQRRLTVDLVLPRDPTRAIAATQDGYRFYLPLALIAKAPPTTNMDLKDEDGRSLPLLNRDQNALLTYGALEACAERVFDGTLPPSLRRVLRQLVHAVGVEAELALEWAYLAISHQYPRRQATRRARLLRELMADFSGNSLLWIGLSGRPGARRVIKLAYDISAPVPPIPRRRPRARVVVAEARGLQQQFIRAEGGDGYPGSTLRRLVNRAANTIGWAPLDFTIQSPYLRGCASYHMQVRPPGGLQPLYIRLAGPLRDKGGAPVEPRYRVSTQSAHLYLNGPIGDRLSFINVRLRAARRGFLSLSLLAASLNSVLLWCFQGRAEQAQKHPGIAAAILLVFPALLTAFAIRPSEHPLVARVLSGVRLLVLLAGALSVAAAAALAEVRPSDWDLSQTWRTYAIACTFIAGVLTISWILPLGMTIHLSVKLAEAWHSRTAYARAAAIGMIGCGLTLALGEWVDDVTGVSWLAAAVLASFVLALIIVATNAPVVAQPPGAGLLPWLAVFSVLISGVALLEFLATDLFSESWRDLWVYLAVLQGGLLAVLGLSELIGYARAAVRARLRRWLHRRKRDHASVR